MNSAAKTAGAALALEPIRRTFMIGADQAHGTLAAIEFGDRRWPVEVLFLHANGFNALTYRAVLAPLGRTLHVVAIDQQGHGLSPERGPVERRTNWLDLRDDLIGVLDGFAGPAVTLAGHSMGATVALLAANERPERVKALALFEPVVFRRPRVGENPLSARALRRRSVFPDRAAVIAAYHGRGAFASFSDQTLLDYVTDGFRDRPDGQVELACSPAWEASNFMAHDHDSLDALRRLRAPATILRADQGSTCAVRSTHDFAADNPRLRIETIPKTSHFLPFERPDLVRETISKMAAT